MDESHKYNIEQKKDRNKSVTDFVNSTIHFKEKSCCLFPWVVNVGKSHQFCFIEALTSNFIKIIDLIQQPMKKNA